MTVECPELIASFARHSQGNTIPKIHRHIEAYRVIPISSDVIRAVVRDDVVTLGDILKHRKASVYDRDERGGLSLL